MNCQDHLYRGRDPQEVTRRWFFEQCGVGLGRIALAGLFAGVFGGRGRPRRRPPSPAMLAQTVACRRPREGRHSPLHGGRAEPPRSLRSQAQAGRVRGQADSAVGHRRAAYTRSSAPTPPCWARGFNLFAHAAKMGPRSPTSCRTLARSSTTWPGPLHAHGPIQPCPGPAVHQHGRGAAGAARAWVRGSSTDWAPNRPISPPLSSCRPGRASAAARPIGRAGSCRQSTAVCDSAIRAIRSSMCLDLPGVSAGLQHDTLELVRTLNRRRLDFVGDPEIATRIASYEMADRLETSAPELMNLRSESRATLEMYGADPDKPSFARACLLARRMVERGVRFINIYHEGWDAHSDLNGNHRQNCLAHRSRGWPPLF